MGLVHCCCVHSFSVLEYNKQATTLAISGCWENIILTSRRWICKSCSQHNRTPEQISSNLGKKESGNLMGALKKKSGTPPPTQTHECLKKMQCNNVMSVSTVVTKTQKSGPKSRTDCVILWSIQANMFSFVSIFELNCPPTPSPFTGGKKPNFSWQLVKSSCTSLMQEVSANRLQATWWLILV